MLLHYFRICLRNLSRQKGLAFINVIGLSIGLACFVLFLFYTVNELTFDRFHEKADRLYRLTRWSEPMNGQAEGGDTYMPMPLGPALQADFSDVAGMARLREGWNASFIRVNGQVSRMPVYYADPALLKMFSFRLKRGNPAAALSDPHGLVITESVARQLFGEADPLGQRVEIKPELEYVPFTVTAVAEDLPPNSTIQFGMLASFAYYETTRSGKYAQGNWNMASFQTFVELRPGSRLPQQSGRLALFRKKFYPNEDEEFRRSGQWTGKGSPIRFRLQPIVEMHTETRLFGGLVPAVHPRTIWVLLGLSACVLVIACINFTTLSIGRSASRAREVGIRKVVGSRKRDLILQFYSEAFLLTLISLGLGLFLAWLLLPHFNELSGRQLPFSFRSYPQMAWLLPALVLLVSAVAGSYPSLVLSGFNPIEVLKSKFRVGGSNLFTRSLVTFQFVLSVGLIIATVVILQQLHFMRSKNPGFKKENIVVVDADGIEDRSVFPNYRRQLMAIPGVMGVSGSEMGIGEGAGWSMTGFQYEGKQRSMYEYFVDSAFLQVLGIRLIAGRNFDSRIALDTVQSIIVNEALAQDFGWTPQTAIGQPLKGYSETKTPVIIGVVRNFHFRPFSEKVQPQLFHQYASYQPYKFFVRLKPGNPRQVIASMQAAWKAAVPDYPFKYSFLDEDIDRFYKGEARWSAIVGWAGGISIFLACLGLFGLVALAVINRTKEVGVRKVLGASVTDIVTLLSRDFLKLVLLAFLIASPVAWYFMNEWLQDFAYRISIHWTVFLLAGGSAVIIALATICIQALKAALANPVKSLRTE